MRGGWKGNLSRNRMSNMKVSVVVSTDSADFAISSYHRKVRVRVRITMNYELVIDRCNVVGILSLE